MAFALHGVEYRSLSHFDGDPRDSMGLVGLQIENQLDRCRAVPSIDDDRDPRLARFDSFAPVQEEPIFP